MIASSPSRPSSSASAPSTTVSASRLANAQVPEAFAQRLRLRRRRARLPRPRRRHTLGTLTTPIESFRVPGACGRGDRVFVVVVVVVGGGGPRGGSRFAAAAAARAPSASSVHERAGRASSERPRHFSTRRGWLPSPSAFAFAFGGRRPAIGLARSRASGGGTPPPPWRVGTRRGCTFEPRPG